MEKKMKDAVELLIKLLEIPSVNSIHPEKDIAEFIVEYLTQHKIRAEMQGVDEKRANVIARINGKSKDRTIVWNGHLDTVSYGAGDNWNTDPSRAVKKDGKIYARGASDMKSGLAAMLFAMTECQDSFQYNIQFIATCDEEKDGMGARRVIEENLMDESEYLLIGEPTGMKLGIAQKGCLWLRIDVFGKTSHGAYPREGINAILLGTEAAREIADYVQLHSHELLGKSTAQVTMISGGERWNMTPDFCRVCMDIRMVPGLDVDMVVSMAEEVMKEKQKKNGEAEIRLFIENNRRAVFLDDSDILVKSMKNYLQEYGYTQETVGINYFTDASVLDMENHRKILLFGPGESSMAHKPDEYVEIKKYLDAISIYKKIARDFKY